MTGKESGAEERISFQRRTRLKTQPDEAIVRENFHADLRAAKARVRQIRASARSEFQDGNPVYDVATVLCVRVAAWFENPKFHRFLGQVMIEEMRAIKTTRNIAAHSGYAQMDNDRFWQTVTVDLPGVIDRLERALIGSERIERAADS